MAKASAVLQLTVVIVSCFLAASVLGNVEVEALPPYQHPVEAPAHPPTPHHHHHHHHHHPPTVAPVHPPTPPPVHPPTPAPVHPPSHHHHPHHPPPPPSPAPVHPPSHPPPKPVTPPPKPVTPPYNPPTPPRKPVTPPPKSVAPPYKSPTPPSKPVTPPPKPVTPPYKPPTPPKPATPPPKPATPPYKPPYKPPTPAPVKPPAHPPVYPPNKRSFVALQGVVYCKSCKYAGNNTLLGAMPILGATVELYCQNTRKSIVVTGKTDKNGYFYIEGPKTLTSYGVHKCKASLVSSPLSNCQKPSSLHGGDKGSALRPEKPFVSDKKFPFILYTVGPFAFEPKCHY